MAGHKIRKKKICYITGTRADYGLMKNVLQKLRKSFGLSLIVTGMHLSPEFGSTVNEIKKDGFKIAGRVKTVLKGDGRADMAKSFALCVEGAAKIIKAERPDWILVMGDRGEALAGAVAGAYANIPVAHVHGGDEGDGGAHVDDLVRHAITKLAHIHFPATQKSAARILRLGEEAWRVHTVGSPALDDIDNYRYRISIVKKKPLIVVIQHAVPSQEEEAGKQIKETLEALKELGKPTILIYPNSDAGGRKMMRIIKQYEKYKFLKTYKSLPRKEYLALLRRAGVLVGNSSSGTIDAPSFHLPAVNIGTRESTREQAGNKIFVGHDRKKIIWAIKKALYDEKFKAKVKKCRNPYGDGKAGERIAKILKRTKINNKLLQKKA